MRRKVGLFLMVGFVLPLVVAASASGQGAVLQLSPSTVRAGDSVQASSPSGYSSGTGANDVVIRLSTRRGRALRSVAANPRGGFDTAVPIPANLSPGLYLVLATQTAANGRQGFSTPGRAKLQVLPASPGAGGGAPGGSTGQAPPLPLLAAILGMVLLVVSGGTLAARRIRMSRPQLGS